jgi:phage baseplate assembly protein V
MSAVIRKFLAPLERRILAAVRIGVAKLIFDDAGLQQLQATVLKQNVRGRINRYQNYGLTSVPLPGAQPLLLSVGGAGNHTVAVAVDDARYRPQNLEPGEVCLYTDEGDRITLQRGRIIAVEAGSAVTVTAPEVRVYASTKVRLETPLVEATGDVVIAGNVLIGGDQIVQGETELQGNVSLLSDMDVAGTLTVVGQISSATAVVDPAGSMEEMRVVYNGHQHDGLGGSVTNPPTTVMS